MDYILPTDIVEITVCPAALLQAHLLKHQPPLSLSARWLSTRCVWLATALAYPNKDFVWLSMALATRAG